MSELIDKERLLKHTKFYNLPNGNRAIDEIDILHAPTVQAIPLDKVKQAREEIENEIKFWSEPSKYNVKPIVAIKNAKAQSYKHCLEIIDKLIESEGKI